MNHNQLHSAIERDAVNLRFKSKTTNKEQVEASTKIKSNNLTTFFLFIKMSVKLNKNVLKKHQSPTSGFFVLFLILALFSSCVYQNYF